MDAMYAGHDGVRFHLSDATSDHSQVVDYQRALERFSLHSVDGNVGQRHVYHGVNRKSMSLDCTERAVGDRQQIDSCDECM